MPPAPRRQPASHRPTTRRPATRRLPRSCPGTGRRAERGSASAELVIATPLLLLLILGIVQFALWEHATHIAQAAAEQGLAAARIQGGGPDAGHQEVEQVLGQIGTGVLTRPAVRSSISGGLAQITITGHAETVLPFLHLPVSATATGPVDAFYPPGATP